MAIKECVICHITFEGTGRAITCSDKCRDIRNKEVHKKCRQSIRARKASNFMHPCQKCKRMIYGSSRMRYCSSCREDNKEMYSERQAARNFLNRNGIPFSKKDDYVALANEMREKIIREKQEIEDEEKRMNKHLAFRDSIKPENTTNINKLAKDVGLSYGEYVAKRDNGTLEAHIKAYKQHNKESKDSNKYSYYG